MDYSDPRLSLSDFFNKLLLKSVDMVCPDSHTKDVIYEQSRHALGIVADQLALELSLTVDQVKAMTIKDIEYIASTDFYYIFIDAVLSIPPEKFLEMPYEEIMFLFGMLQGNILVKREQIKRSREISEAEKTTELLELTEKINNSAIIQIIEGLSNILDM
jgi:hypothetical protein